GPGRLEGLLLADRPPAVRERLPIRRRLGPGRLLKGQLAERFVRAAGQQREAVVPAALDQAQISSGVEGGRGIVGRGGEGALRLGEAVAFGLPRLDVLA